MEGKWDTLLRSYRDIRVIRDRLVVGLTGLSPSSIVCFSLYSFAPPKLLVLNLSCLKRAFFRCLTGRLELLTRMSDSDYSDKIVGFKQFIEFVTILRCCRRRRKDSSSNFRFRARFLTRLQGDGWRPVFLYYSTNQGQISKVDCPHIFRLDYAGPLGFDQ